MLQDRNKIIIFANLFKFNFLKINKLDKLQEDIHIQDVLLMEKLIYGDKLTKIQILKSLKKLNFKIFKFKLKI